jgi:hypothetical protein
MKAMTKPATPGIAELLDACIDAHMGNYSEAVNDGPRARAAVLAHVADLEAQRDEALKDAGRIEFLESLMQRTAKFGHAGKVWPLATDFHINSMGASIYARTGVGSAYEFSGHGSTVREAIDAAIAQRGGSDA